MKFREINRRSFVTGITGAVAAAHFQAFAAKEEGAGTGPVVDTTYGKLRGTSGNKLLSFRGVPYGGSTAGAGRFMPPTKPQPWTGVKDCKELGPISPQTLPGIEPPEVASTIPAPMLSEDCLVLNVWTPSTRAGKRPVMVWLHGGGFTSGSAGYTIYDGGNLARKHDVVVVGINHRLNAFGFLYLAEIGGSKYAEASNAGMLDIVAALQWVRDNIEHFGGDPGNVTIFGQSGGGGKVSTLLAMPAAKGLFHKAIQQSGANIRGVSREAANKTAEAYLAKLGLKADQLDRLHEIPMQQLVDATRGPFQFAPVVDGKTLPANPFDPAAPELSADVPLLIGSTENEITFFQGSPLFNFALDPIDDATLHKNMKQVLRADDASTDAVIAAYKKERQGISNLDLFVRAASDNFVRTGILTEADRKVAQHKAPVYVYYFDWKSPVREGKLGAYHTLEIPFVFDNLDVAKTMVGDGKGQTALEDKMSAAWTAFARSGNPSTKGLPQWPAYNTEQRPTMILGNDCKVTNDPNREELAALTSIKRG
jgi:para-nitrobenzyl esterase